MDVKIYGTKDRFNILPMVGWCIENLSIWNFSIVGKCHRWHVNGPTIITFSNYTQISEIRKSINDTYFFDDGSIIITASFKNEEDVMAFKLRWT